jgi:hypothetical protein
MHAGFPARQQISLLRISGHVSPPTASSHGRLPALRSARIRGCERNDAEAIVLDLVQPLAAGRQLISFGWKARRDKPDREGTLQHAG